MFGPWSTMFPCPAGLHVEYDLSRPPGRRVKSLSILCTKCRVPQYEPVEDEAVYTVVLPSYIMTGGDGFSMLKNETLKHNSGEFGRSGESVFCHRAETRVFISLFYVPFQVIWTFQSCPSTSRKGRRFIRLLKDASRSTTQPLDKLLRWFYWFHWDFCGLCVGACKADGNQATRELEEMTENMIWLFNFSTFKDALWFSFRLLKEFWCKNWQ